MGVVTSSANQEERDGEQQEKNLRQTQSKASHELKPSVRQVSVLVVLVAMEQVSRKTLVALLGTSTEQLSYRITHAHPNA